MSSGNLILLISLNENPSSGKTYFYTVTPRSSLHTLSPAPEIEPHGLPEPGAGTLDEPDAAVVPRVDAV